MNKKKVLYTTLVALTLASFSSRTFAEETGEQTSGDNIVGTAVSTSTSNWVAGRVSGGVIYADRVVLTNADTGEVLYDGTPGEMTGWSDLLAYLGLPTDLTVGGQGGSSDTSGTVHYGSVSLPKEDNLSDERNKLLVQVDKSNLSVEQKSALAEKIVAAETSEELSTIKEELEKLISGFDSGTEATVTPNDKTTTSDAPGNSSTTSKSSSKKTLPNTGDAASILGLLGLGLTAFGAVANKRRR